jgi:hypothetical protein
MSAPTARPGASPRRSLQTLFLGTARLPRLAAVALLVAACGEEQPAPRAAGDDALASDSTLARDLTLAPAPEADVAFADTLSRAGAAPVNALPPAAQPDAAPAAPAAPSPAPPPAERATTRTPAPRPARREPTVAAAPRPAPATRDSVSTSPAESSAAPPVPTETTGTASAVRGRGRVGIGAGTVLGFTTAARVCTSTNVPGDKIIATLDAPSAGSNGFTLAAGTKAVLEFAEVERDAQGEPTGLAFRVRNLDDGTTAYPVVGEVTTSDSLRRTRSNRNPAGDRRKVVGGAIVGAVLGQVIGKDTKGTVIGAAAGGAAGAAATVRGARYEGCLPEGAKVQLRLSEPLVP